MLCNVDDVIVKGLIKEKIANLEEFRFFFHDGAQVVMLCNVM